MKRLLAYLFIVLGLGLVVSVNANAEIPQSLKPANIEKQNHWNNYKNYLGQKIWAEVRKSKLGSTYNYSWRGRNNLENAFNTAMEACEKIRKIE